MDFPFFGAKRGLPAVLGVIGRIIATYEDIDKILHHFVEPQRKKL